MLALACCRNLAPMLGEGDFPCPTWRLCRLPTAASSPAGDCSSMHALSEPRQMPRPTSLFVVSAGTIGASHRARHRRPWPYRQCPRARGGTRHRRTVGHGPRQHGQGNAWRLAGELPYAARRQGREMRAGAECHRGGSAECRADGGVLQSHRRGQEALARRGAARRAAPHRTRTSRSTDRMSATRPSSNAARRDASPKSCCRTR